MQELFYSIVNNWKGASVLVGIVVSVVAIRLNYLRTSKIKIEIDQLKEKSKPSIIQIATDEQVERFGGRVLCCTNCEGSGKNGSYTCSSCGGSGTSQTQNWKSHYGGCFSSSTLVLTPSGWQRIDEVNKGNKVFSYDHQANEFVSARIKSRKDHKDIRIFNLCIDNEIIETTCYHPFFTSKGWVQAKNLNDGDQLLTSSGSFVTVDNSEMTDRYEITHNLIVEGYYNYIVVGGVVANSFCHFWNIRTLLNKAIDKRRNPIFDPILSSL